MIKFLLIFLSSCTFGRYDCVHEIMTFETYADCAEFQEKRSDYHPPPVCAMVVEGSERQFDIQSLGNVAKETP